MIFSTLKYPISWNWQRWDSPAQGQQGAAQVERARVAGARNTPDTHALIHTAVDSVPPPSGHSSWRRTHFHSSCSVVFLQPTKTSSCIHSNGMLGDPRTTVLPLGPVVQFAPSWTLTAVQYRTAVNSQDQSYSHHPAMMSVFH